MTGGRFRFAPTPSHSLHLGNALAALIGWSAARIAGGTFIIRIEDIDRERSREAYIEGALDALEWLGIDWDEGPRVGGDHGPYRQSERLHRYDERLDILAERGASYPCTCSRADIRAAQRAPHLHVSAERPYPGTCRPRPGSEPLGLLADRGGYRLDVVGLGAMAEVTWEDTWSGSQHEDVRSTCGDVLLGRRSQPTYQLAVVSDDLDMGITHVVRGEDLLGSTARQILLYRALESAPPRFAHHPLLLDDEGRKLSKRDEALSLDAWRSSGISRPELLALLGRSLGLVSSATRTMTPEDWTDAVFARSARWASGPLEELTP